MRILHTSDWHLGRNLEQFSRIEEQREFIDCLCKLVKERSIDLVLVAGDIYDTYNPSAAAEELFYDAIDRLSGKGKRAVIVIAGNHDSPERLCAASPLAYKNGTILLGYPKSDAGVYKTDSGSMSIVESGPGWLELSVPGCKEHAVIITLPFPSEARLEEVLAKNADEGAIQKAYSEKIGSIFALLSQKFRDDTVNIGVGHLFLRGGKESESERTLQIGGALTVDPSVLPAGAHYIALGHLHRPQEVKNAPCPVFYSGSPLAYSFSEADYSKAVFIIDVVPGKKAEIEPVYLDCGKPLRRWVAEQGIGQALEWCEEGRDKNAWIDLEIATDRVLTLEEQKRLKTLHPGIINIRPRLKTDIVEVLSPGSRENRKIDELFRDYYKYRMDREISDELMKAFIEVINEEEEELDDILVEVL
ncbi:MAG: exonuclease subunit SbcD [Clostridium sp.]|nr:exonuclease subunit SbcD [Clostridium sp.]